MNREQKRKYLPLLKKKGLNKESIDAFLNRYDAEHYKDYAWEGEKVRLNYLKIITDKDYRNKTATYKTWVEENKNELFTVEFDPLKKEEEPTRITAPWVQFVEDTTDPKWLFWAGDLITEDGQEDINDIINRKKSEKVKNRLSDALKEFNNPPLNQQF